MGSVCGCCCEEPVDFDSDVNLFHFNLHRSVGRGAFGKVRVVEHKRDKQLYALKYINKSRCIRMKAVNNIIQERRLLEEIDHPFVVNLRYAFQDDENCFFVLDLMLGGDLRFHFERKGPLPEDHVRFYVAEISSALIYLHGEKKIVHRDLKPDNILLDIKGHVHLTDFNVAAHFEDKKPLTSVTGTMSYLAPEVFKKKGYSYTTDWWALGVCAYELMFARRPFQKKKTAELLASIVSAQYEYPEEFLPLVTPESLDIISKLLEKDPTRRLGCRRGAQGFMEFRKHPWFRTLDWDKLDAKQLQPPFVPDPNKLNFDFTHELDEYMVPSEYLTAQKRKNMDVEKLTPELRQMEEEFTVYDFQKMQRKSYYPLNAPVVAVKPSQALPGSTPPSRPASPSPDSSSNGQSGTRLSPPCPPMRAASFDSSRSVPVSTRHAPTQSSHHHQNQPS